MCSMRDSTRAVLGNLAGTPEEEEEEEEEEEKEECFADIFR